MNGLWTGISLLKRGFSVTIIDQFGLNNDRGSSHGQSRITRYLYDEPTYPAFMPESDRKWKQLQKSYNTNLYKRSEFEYSCTRFEESFCCRLGGIDISILIFRCGLIFMRCETSHKLITDIFERYDRSYSIINDELLADRYGIDMSWNQSNIETIVEEGAGVLYADKCIRLLGQYFCELGYDWGFSIHHTP